MVVASTLMTLCLSPTSSTVMTLCLSPRRTTGVVMVAEHELLHVFNLGLVAALTKLPKVEVPQPVDRKEVRAQYHELAKIMHPDRLKADPEALAAFQR